VLSFSFDHNHYGQKKKTTLRSTEKENTMVKGKKTTLWSKEKDNTMVKRKRQQCGQKKKTTVVLSFSFDRSVGFLF
jgi:hypothetical protein